MSTRTRLVTAKTRIDTGLNKSTMESDSKEDSGFNTNRSQKMKAPSKPVGMGTTKKKSVSIQLGEKKIDASPSFSERQQKVIKDQGLKIETVPISLSEEDK